MKDKRNKIILAVLTLIVFAMLAFYLTRPKEPSYEGKTLTQWLEVFANETLRSGTPNPDAPVHANSVRAVRAIGTNGIPVLLDLLKAKDLPGTQQFETTIQRSGWKSFQIGSAQDKHWLGRLGFSILGKEAHLAAPALNALLVASPAEFAWDIASCIRCVEPTSLHRNTVLTDAAPVEK